MEMVPSIVGTCIMGDTVEREEEAMQWRRWWEDPNMEAAPITNGEPLRRWNGTNVDRQHIWAMGPRGRRREE